MTITARYKFSLDDYRLLARVVASRGRLGRWTTHALIAALMAGASLVGLIGGMVSTGRLPSLSALVGPLGTTVALTLAMLVVFEIVLRSGWIYRRAFNKLALADKAMAYELGDMGVAWRRDGMSGAFDWSTITGAVVEPEAIVLLISRIEGVVLPARAFASRAEFDAAVAMVRSRTEGATGGAASV